MARRDEQGYPWNGYLYVPCHSVPLSAGPFLSLSWNSIEQHLALPPDFALGLRDRHMGSIRVHRARLASARIHGDSMIDRNILHGDIAVFQCGDVESLQNGRVVVIEKVGEEEGYGAWALKKLVIERPRSFNRNEYEDQIDWDDPIITLYSFNKRVSSWRLDPSGRYRVHGIFLRCVRRHDANLVDSDVIRRAAASE